MTQVYQIANELKVVIFHPSDLDWALNHEKKIVNKSCELYIQPEWSKMNDHLSIILTFLERKSPMETFSQTHKFLNIP